MTSPPPSTSSGTDRAAVKGGVKIKRSSTVDDELSVFDIHNIFRRCWFLSRTHLLNNIISAQKDEDGKISWVEFTPPYHSHLVKCAVALVPHPVHKVKKVMFVYILELLNEVGHEAFFELQKGGRKANNAQKEKRRLARKRSRASKHEREREAAKAAKLPLRQRQCVACGRKFESRKTAKKHKCPKAKVEHVRKEAASGQASQATPAAKLDKPPATPTTHAPTTHPAAMQMLANINIQPAVTGDLREGSRPGIFQFKNKETGVTMKIRDTDCENLDGLRMSGLWYDCGWSPLAPAP